MNTEPKTNVGAQELEDTDLDTVQGGIALLLPAVQAARREAAVLDFALTGDDNFSEPKPGLRSKG